MPRLTTRSMARIVSRGRAALGHRDPFLSLAVEEQFYVIWPFVMLGCCFESVEPRSGQKYPRDNQGVG